MQYEVNFRMVLCIQAGIGAAKTIMMTMIPIDYHTCFVAISQHAKILYANESMANLLGRKVTEISNKMSLPQLMTIPCQQLHQNFFKVRRSSLALKWHKGIALRDGMPTILLLVDAPKLAAFCKGPLADTGKRHLKDCWAELSQWTRSVGW